MFVHRVRADNRRQRHGGEFVLAILAIDKQHRYDIGTENNAVFDHGNPCDSRVGA
jgi:hypothetical protein